MIDENHTPLPKVRYHWLLRLLHWIIGLIVLALLASGLLIWFLGFEGVTHLLGEASRNMLYEYHKTFGMIVLVLMLIRLFVRFETGKPSYVNRPALAVRALSAVVQYLFYILLIAQALIGIMATDALNFPLEFFHWNLPQFIAKDEGMGKALYEAHAWIGWGLVILVVLHVGGALKHWLFMRDGVMGRMRPF